MTEQNRPFIRVLISIVLPIALIALTLLPLFIFRDRLPDPLATHWGMNGPNGSMSYTFLFVFELVFVGVPALAMTRIAQREPAGRGEISIPTGIMMFVATMMLAISWSIVAANLDVADWTEARLVSFREIAWALGVALIAAASVYWLARFLESATAPEALVPGTGITPGSDASWNGKARSLWALPLMLIMLGLGIAMILRQQPAAGLILCVIGLIGLPFTSIRVTVDRQGVHWAYGSLGWPARTLPLGDISRAAVVDVVPLKHGGWGYRGSLTLFGRAAIVLRGGEGIEFRLTNDKVLTITVDDATRGAGLINDLLAVR